jgi:hypothetical protein
MRATFRPVVRIGGGDVTRQELTTQHPHSRVRNRIEMIPGKSFRSGPSPDPGYADLRDARAGARLKLLFR